jgi:hypothetical protein
MISSRQKQIHSHLILLMIASSMPRAAMTAEVLCPVQIPAPAVRIQATDGWTSYTPRDLPLTSAGFTASPPAQLEELKPYAIKETKRRLTETWRFDGPYDGGKWISCGFAGGKVTLAKKIAADTATCVVTYDKPTNTSYASPRIHCR